MTPEEFETWLREQPFLLALLGLLLLGSLISFIVLMRQVSHSRRLGRNPIPPWPLANTDFALFITALVLWFVLSGSLLLHLHSWIAGKDNLPGTGVMVLGGFLLQAGMLYLFLRFRFHYRTPGEGPISPRIISLPRAMFLGLFYFLASLPIVYGVGVLWNGFLEFLRQRGVEIELPLQDAVLLLQETSSPVTFFGLVLLAVVVAPVVEESVFRAGVYRFFKGRVSITAALLISGTLFGMIHGNLQSLPGLIAVGVCLGLAYELSGSLRVAIFFHACFNLNSIVWILLIPDSFTG
jgi:membrane protease YdiL (CAAX protease family)